eukprot:TRINITY_DN80144_c0_g1_i1.p1 TRINITY_DN80144_c0_g1~~TRINITY_DN80144_c0_g1_i1.p1  ORF type:complete len:1236 (-),score=244.74 TRINITY_DN80144_c0_g1_i1:316-4023(-)
MARHHDSSRPFLLERFFSLAWAAVVATLLCRAGVQGQPGYIPSPATNDPLRQWLSQVRIDLPPMQVDSGNPVTGILDLDGGSCTGLSIQHILAQDLGTAQKPVIGYSLSGLTLGCKLHALRETFIVDFGVTVDVLNLEFEFNQNSEVQGPAFALGQVLVTKCTLDVTLTNLQFSGTSDLIPTLEGNRELIQAGVREVVRDFACKYMKPIVGAVETFVCGLIAKALAPIENGNLGALSLPTPRRLEPNATQGATLREDRRLQQTPAVAAAQQPGGQALSWDRYAPFLLGSALVAERPEAIQHATSYLPYLTVPLGLSMSPPPELLQQASVPADFAASVSVGALQLGGINTLDAKQLRLEGSGPQITLTAALANIRLKIPLVIHLNASTTYPQLDLPLTIDFALSDLTVRAAISAAMVEQKLDGLKIDQLQEPGCLVACAVGTDPASAGASFAVEQLVADAAGRPQIGAEAAAATLTEELGKTMDVATEAMLKGHEDASEALIKNGATIVLPIMNQGLREAVASQYGKCQDSKVFHGPGKALCHSVLVFALVVLLVGTARALWKVFSAAGSADDNGDKKLLGGTLKAIANHPVVPRCLSDMYPFFCVATGCCLLYSDIQVGTTVDVTFRGSEYIKTIPSVFSFSLIESVIDSFSAGAVIIASATLCLSGIWPVIKLSLLIYCWLTPPSRLNVNRRGRILRFLDEYGKYSLLDTFLALFAFAAYQMSWAGTTASVEAQPVAKDAFFMFVIGTMLSLVAGHIGSVYHEWTLEWDSHGGHYEDNFPNELRPLCQSASSSQMELGLALAIPVTFIMIVLSSILPAFKIFAYGIAAEMIASEDELSHEHSILTFGLAIAGKATTTPLVLRCLQLVLYGFAVVMPLLLMIGLFCLWIIPMPPRYHATGLLLCKILQSWSSFDVFVLSVLVAVFELTRFAGYLVYNSNIAAVCNWVRDNFHTDCFAVGCQVLPGYFFMLMTAVAVVVVPKVALRESIRAARAVVHEDKAGFYLDDYHSSMGVEDSPIDGAGMIRKDMAPGAMFDDEEEPTEYSLLTLNCFDQASASASARKVQQEDIDGMQVSPHHFDEENLLAFPKALDARVLASPASRPRQTPEQSPATTMASPAQRFSFNVAGSSPHSPNWTPSASRMSSVPQAGNAATAFPFDVANMPPAPRGDSRQADPRLSQPSPAQSRGFNTPGGMMDMRSPSWHTVVAPGQRTPSGVVDPRTPSRDLWAASPSRQY